VVQIYETGLVQPGASVAYVVLNLSKHLSKLGHDVTVLERGEAKASNPCLKCSRIREIRVNVKQLASTPCEDIRSLTGLCRLFMDRYALALKFNKVLKSENFDIVHVHFPFAANILASLNKELREKMVYTAQEVFVEAWRQLQL
jgi:hypothetical protein